MTLVLEAAVLGVLTGGVYALMASGLTLIFGVMRIINVGHGALVVLGFTHRSWANFVVALPLIWMHVEFTKRSPLTATPAR